MTLRQFDQQTGEVLDGETFEVPPLTPEQKLKVYAAALLDLAEAKETAERIEIDIINDIVASGGTAIPSDIFICELKVTNSYDQTRFIPLKEELNDTEMGHCWEPEYDKLTIVPAKFNTVKLKAVVNKRGGKAKDIFEGAMLPGAPSLKFERRT